MPPYDLDRTKAFLLVIRARVIKNARWYCSEQPEIWRNMVSKDPLQDYNLSVSGRYQEGFFSCMDDMTVSIPLLLPETLHVMDRLISPASVNGSFSTPY
jgi:hypothetical protein